MDNLSTDIELVNTIIDISNNTVNFTFPDIKHDCSNNLIVHNIKLRKIIIIINSRNNHDR